MDSTAKKFIEHLRLQQHPEGGWFRETYRSTEQVAESGLPSRYGGSRSFSTAIYFLLEGDQYSAFHRIKSDELWHFYCGEALRLYVLHPQGEMETIDLGQHGERGEVFQATVRAGCWFASEVASAGSFALVGCTVSPGFDFSDFELADGVLLAQQYPTYEKIIKKLSIK